MTIAISEDMELLMRAMAMAAALADQVIPRTQRLRETADENYRWIRCYATGQFDENFRPEDEGPDDLVVGEYAEDAGSARGYRSLGKTLLKGAAAFASSHGSRISLPQDLGSRPRS